jgi:hypothetical protein
MNAAFRDPRSDLRELDRTDSGTSHREPGSSAPFIREIIMMTRRFVLLGLASAGLAAK